jgi:PAS domain S-box-containing protein
MQLNLSLSQKGIALVSIPLLFELVFLGALAYLQTMAEQETTRALRAAAVSDATNQLVRDFFNLAAVSRGELVNTFGSGNYEKQADKLRNDIATLRLAVKDNPDQTKIVDRTGQAAQDAYEEIEKLRKYYVAGETYKALDEMNAAKPRVRNYIKTALSSDLIFMAEKEKAVLQKSTESQAKFRQQIKLALISGVVLNIILTVSVALAFSKNIVRRLQLLVDNSYRLASRLPLNAPIGGGDEISTVDTSFHTMAEELNEAQRKERALLNNAVDVICSIDTSGKFTAMSPASEQVFGFSEYELLGKNLTKIVHKDDIEHTQQALERIMSGSKEPPFEARVIRKDKKTIDVLFGAHWNPTEDSIFCVAHNITERKDAERMRQEVVQMVSHDLRTPLATIQTFHEMLETGMFGELTGRGQQLLKKADINTSRMLGLINDLLDIEKIKAGGFEIYPETIPVQDTLETAAKSISDWAMEKGVLITTIPTSLEFYADDKRIVQVLVNLLSNAVKFSPHGGTVVLSAEESGSRILIKVIDEGRGVPEELRERIFERFQQVQASDAKDKGGSGLGLAICKAIVELHGGKIGVEPNGTQGSVFHFTVGRNSIEKSQSNPVITLTEADNT